MDEIIDVDDDVVLPGFRFHPTDEELVEFYLKRKIQNHHVPIELIKQVDIYKYNPWDLPKLTTIGEKEWYFYCPRDRKYRNSTRPNRVTGTGFWKATGTDRPIYSSDRSNCIGLKKSLVFYRGRAAKGVKTDWMMHEFRLPYIPDPTGAKKLPNKSFNPLDSWAICRIFKKANSTEQKHLSLSHLWFSPLEEGTKFTTNDLKLQASPSTFSDFEIPTYKNLIQPNCKPLPPPMFSGSFEDQSNGLLVSFPIEVSESSMLFLNHDSIDSSCDNVVFDAGQDQFSGFSSSFTEDEMMEPIGLPFTLQENELIPHINAIYASSSNKCSWNIQ